MGWTCKVSGVKQEACWPKWCPTKVMQNPTNTSPRKQCCAYSWCLWCCIWVSTRLPKGWRAGNWQPCEQPLKLWGCTVLLGSLAGLAAGTLPALVAAFAHILLGRCLRRAAKCRGGTGWLWGALLSEFILSWVTLCGAVVSFVVHCVTWYHCTVCQSEVC